MQYFNNLRIIDNIGIIKYIQQFLILNSKKIIANKTTYNNIIEPISKLYNCRKKMLFYKQKLKS